jgi:hypothetical protein
MKKPEFVDARQTPYKRGWYARAGEEEGLENWEDRLDLMYVSPSETGFDCEDLNGTHPLTPEMGQKYVPVPDPERHIGCLCVLTSNALVTRNLIRKRSSMTAEKCDLMINTLRTVKFMAGKVSELEQTAQTGDSSGGSRVCDPFGWPKESDD